MTDELKFEFLHSLFVLKSLLGAEFGNSKTDQPTLSMPEYILMKKTAETESGCTDLTQVREYLAVSKAAISQMLSSLERRGLLVREIAPQNRRNLLLTLTPAGEGALESKRIEVEQRVAEIVSCMGQAETEQFTALIGTLKMP